MLRRTTTLSANDRTSLTLLAPDWALPSQMATRYSQETGERALMRAVLEQALTDLRLSARLRPPKADEVHADRVRVAVAAAYRRKDPAAASRIRAAVRHHTFAGRAWQARQDLIAWFSSDDERPLYSFARICHHLGFDPAAFRERLAKRRWVPRDAPSAWRDRMRANRIGAGPNCQRRGDSERAPEVREILVRLRAGGWTNPALARATKLPASCLSAWRLGQYAPLDGVDVLRRLRPLLERQPGEG